MQQNLAQHAERLQHKKEAERRLAFEQILHVRDAPELEAFYNAQKETYVPQKGHKPFEDTAGVTFDRVFTLKRLSAATNYAEYWHSQNVVTNDGSAGGSLVLLDRAGV